MQNWIELNIKNLQKKNPQNSSLGGHFLLFSLMAVIENGQQHDSWKEATWVDHMKSHVKSPLEVPFLLELFCSSSCKPLSGYDNDYGKTLLTNHVIYLHPQESWVNFIDTQ